MPRISAFTALTSPASNDLLPIVDVSDTSMAPSGTTKQITYANLESSLTSSVSTEASRATSAENALRLGSLVQTAVKTSGYTAAVNDLVRADLTSGNVTVTLPSAPANGATVGIKIVKMGSSPNTATITCGGSDVFNVASGSTSLTMTLLNESMILLYESGVWVKYAAENSIIQSAQAREGTFFLDSYTGSDDARFASILTAVQSANAFGLRGGTINLSPRAHVFTSPWVSSTFSGSIKYVIRIKGAGVSNATGEGAPTGATTCDMQFNGGGNPAKMDFRHDGGVEISGVLFQDTTGGTLPFFQNTNTVAYIHDCAFVGSQTGTACNQDAVYFGGTNVADVLTGQADAPFQGYQSVIERCVFHGIRTAVWCRTYANSVSMRDLMINASCGSPYLFTATDGAMTATSSVLTCATSSPFTSGMVGQVILVAGAGVPNQNNWLLAVISTFTDSSHVTLSAPASTSVTGASVYAPVASAIQIGNTTGSSQGGCVIDSCCIEVNNYPIAILLNNTIGNAITATSLWDGAVIKCGVGCVNTSGSNYINLSLNGLAAGTATYLTDRAGGTGGVAGQDTVIAHGGGPNPVIQLAGLTLTGSQPLNVFGAGSTVGGAAIAFGPYGGPADSWMLRDSGGSIDITPASGAFFKVIGPTSGTNALFGCAVNQVQIGPASTGDIYWIPQGTGTVINSRFRTKGTGSYIDLQSHIISALSGTPTIAGGAGAGSSPTVAVTGNDNRGIITITTGASGTAAGVLATITFNQTWASIGTPFVQVTGDGTGSTTVTGPASLLPGVAARTATTFELVCANAPATSTTYVFTYQVLG